MMIRVEVSIDGKPTRREMFVDMTVLEMTTVLLENSDYRVVSQHANETHLVGESFGKQTAITVHRIGE